MLRLTLDWNCLVALEEKEPAACFISELQKYEKLGKVSLQLTAVSAAERQREGVEYLKRIKEFRDRVSRAGLDPEKLLDAPGRVAKTVIGHSAVLDGATAEIAHEILRIMCPRFATLSDGQRRNARCDADTLVAHIIAKNDAFVTSNIKDFQKNAVALSAFGVGLICTPCEALGLVRG